MLLRGWSQFWVIHLGWLLAGLVASRAAPRTSAPEVEIRSWTAQDGVPGVEVTSLQQTADGFLWVGASAGLARFDGFAFELVTTPTKPAGEAHGPAAVTSQAVDAGQRVWFGTDQGGLFRLETQAPGLRATLAGLEHERVSCLGVEGEEILWIGTDQGLTRHVNGRFERVLAGLTADDPAVLALQVTRSHGVWITTRSGLHRVQGGQVQRGAYGEGRKDPFLGVFEDQAGSLWGFGDTYLLNLSENRRFNYFRGGGATQLQVWSICEGRPGQLWIGTSGQGLFYFAGTRFHAVDLQQGSGHPGVRAVLTDRDGQIWVGTRRGLLRLREKTARWFSAGDAAATALVEDPDGRVWAGFEHGGLMSGTDGQLEPLSGSTPLAGLNLVSTLYARGDGSLWAGTLGHGLYRAKHGRAMQFTLAHGLADETVLALCGGLAGRVWVATADGRVQRYVDQLGVTFDQRHGLTGSPVTAMIRAAQGGLWLGTAEGEILKFANERFTPAPGPAEFRGRKITALLETGTNTLWAGSHGGGLARLAAGQWRIWNHTRGLPNNQVTGLECSRSGELWVATTAGIARLPALPPDGQGDDSGRLRMVMEVPAGRGEDEGGWPRSLRSRDGLIWFATTAGVVCFNPDHLRSLDSAPRVYVDSVRINGGKISPAPAREAGERLFRLPAGLRDVELHFAAPALTRPERTRFRHKLEGFDPDWVDSTATRVARYGRLPAGRYEFRVAASNPEGSWVGPETQARIEVEQPLWQQSWALTLEVVLLASVVGGTVRVISHRRLRRQLARAEQQRAMERERSRIARDMHDELGAKLTKISFLSERARHDVAAESPTSARLDSISVTSRELLKALDEIVWAVNPRNDNLEHLAGYLEQYAREYFLQTPVECGITVPSALPKVELSAELRHNVFLAFEEALGNTLKHADPSRVDITMTVRGAEFEIVVQDDGRGFAAGEAARAGRNGLNNMRARMRTVGGECVTESQPGQGTAVRLRCPLPEAVP